MKYCHVPVKVFFRFLRIHRTNRLYWLTSNWDVFCRSLRWVVCCTKTYEQNPCEKPCYLLISFLFQYSKRWNIACLIVHKISSFVLDCGLALRLGTTNGACTKHSFLRSSYTYQQPSCIRSTVGWRYEVCHNCETCPGWPQGAREVSFMDTHFFLGPTLKAQPSVK